MLFHTPFVHLLKTSILGWPTSKKDLWWTFQTRYNPPAQIGLKQMSGLDLRGTSCTIAGVPKDPSHTFFGLPRDVHSMIVLKWWIWKFHYFLVKILKILIGPNENLNTEKFINRFGGNLNRWQFAFVTKVNEDSWRFLMLVRRKQHSLWKMKFFLLEQKTIAQDNEHARSAAQ